MKSILGVLALLLTSCVTKYPLVTDIENSAIFKFKQDSDTALSSTSSFVKVDKDFICDSSGGYLDQQSLGMVSEGNPFASSENENGMRVYPEKEFRLLIRNVPANILGQYRCDVIVKFKVEKQKNYLITFSRKNDLCSAIVEDITKNNGNSSLVDLIDSTSC